MCTLVHNTHLTPTYLFHSNDFNSYLSWRMFCTCGQLHVQYLVSYVVSPVPLKFHTSSLIESHKAISLDIWVLKLSSQIFCGICTIHSSHINYHAVILSACYCGLYSVARITWHSGCTFKYSILDILADYMWSITAHEDNNILCYVLYTVAI